MRSSGDAEAEMPGFFHELGARTGKALRQGNWIWQSLTGTDADRIAAEEVFGRDLAAAVRAELNVPDFPTDIGRSAWLNSITTALAGRLKEKRRTFRVAIVDAGEPNAFALPGGFLFVHRSLLELCGWDRDEVAFVVGHEMAHVVHDHTLQRIMGGQGLARIAGSVPLGGPAAMVARQVGLALLTSAYGRDQEFDADQFGTRLASAAGFAPGGGARLLGRLQRDVETVPGSRLAAYFASHPPLAERIAALRRFG
jgi:Zn-dependent protease with chaperone function